MLALREVSKRYGAIVALRDVSLTVARGEVVGVVGPNGAGKSTLLRLAAGFYDPDSGRVEIDGVDAAAERALAQRGLGYLADAAPCPEEATVEGWLWHRAAIKGVARARRPAAVAAALEALELTSVGHRVVGTLSKGYRQRVGLADCVIGDPELLILDEPGSGLDPLAARALRERLRAIAARRAVLLSSHALGELEALADRVVVLAAGRIVASGSPAELVARAGAATLDDAVASLVESAASAPLEAGASATSTPPPSAPPSALEGAATPGATSAPPRAPPSPRAAPRWLIARVLGLELYTFLRTPAPLLIGALFLLVQGASLAALLSTLTDASRPAPLGTVLEAHLGGTVLSWALLCAVIALFAVRVITEPMRSGEWEALVTSGVSERAAILGKLGASAALLAALWLPTAASLAVVATFVRGPLAWDLGASAAGLFGGWALACGILAACVAACAMTRSPLVGGAAATCVGLGLLLAGELPAFAPELCGELPWVAAVARALSLRQHAAAFARGDVTATALLVIGGLVVTGASAAIAASTRRRHRASSVRSRVVATALLAAASVVGAAAAQRGGAAWDVSFAGRNTLSEATRSVLAELRGPVELIVVEPTLAALTPVYAHAAQVLARMSRASSSVAVRSLDPATLPGGLAAAARVAGVSPRDLASSGAIIVRVGDRQRVIDLFELAELAPTEAGPDVSRWSAERAVATRLAELVRPAAATVCVSLGHGEVSLAGERVTEEYAALAARLRDEGLALVAPAPGSLPATCHVVLVAAPTSPWSPDEALELARFVERGGGLVVGLSSRALDPSGRPPPTGLELVLAAAGLATPPAIAVDPDGALGAGALRVLDGYAAHEVNRGFLRARPTVWWTPRVVEVAAPARALVSASAASWGETDLGERAPARDERDVAGPVTLAGALDPEGGGRVVVFGSMESAASAVLAGGSALDLWLARALRWAARRPLPVVPVAEPDPGVARVVMTRGERRAVSSALVFALPALWLVAGLAIRRQRRKRA